MEENLIEITEILVYGRKGDDNIVGIENKTGKPLKLAAILANGKPLKVYEGCFIELKKVSKQEFNSTLI